MFLGEACYASATGYFRDKALEGTKWNFWKIKLVRYGYSDDGFGRHVDCYIFQARKGVLGQWVSTRKPVFYHRISLTNHWERGLLKTPGYSEAAESAMSAELAVAVEEVCEFATQKRNENKSVEFDEFSRFITSACVVDADQLRRHEPMQIQATAVLADDVDIDSVEKGFLESIPRYYGVFAAPAKNMEIRHQRTVKTEDCGTIYYFMISVYDLRSSRDHYQAGWRTYIRRLPKEMQTSNPKGNWDCQCLPLLSRKRR